MSKNVEESLIKIPPKFILDHYWEVLNFVAWEGFSLIKENSFGINDLKEEFSKRAQEFYDINPIVSRVYTRSLDTIEETINQLVNLGLLVEEEKTIKRTEDFKELYLLLKDKIKVSLKRLIAWIILYLSYTRGLRKFTTHDFISLISYSDEECEKELDYLIKWEDYNWLLILEKQNNIWKLLREPYLTTKPFLLTSINERLQIVISKLSKQGNEFTTQQIIEKLRQLECKYEEMALAKIGLIRVDKVWYIDDNIIEKVKLTLLKPIEEELHWPSFGIRVTVDPYFKIEGKAQILYVDMPNDVITLFLQELYNLSEVHQDNLDLLYNEACKLKDNFNEFFRQRFGNWLSIIIRKEFLAKRPFGVQIKIDWYTFQKFLEDFIEREDISLEEKYEYLSICRSGLAWMRTEPSKDLMEDRVKSISASSIEKINNTLKSFVEELIERKKKYRMNLLLRRRIQPLTLSYLPEMILTFHIISDCINKGSISTCYREMRKILESISWVIIDDILLFRKRDFLKRFDFIPPLRIPCKEWYDWARGKGLIIRSLNDWIKPIQFLIEKIGENYNISKNEVKKSLLDNITYPLFIISAGTKEMPSNNLKDILLYDAEKIKPLIKENIDMILSQLLNKPLQDSDEKLVGELTDSLITTKHICVRYPSNSFIIQLLSEISHQNILSFYERYSYFVHSYDRTWQFYPFSSVAEFKIYLRELTRFIELLTQILNFYEKEIMYSTKHDMVNSNSSITAPR